MSLEIADDAERSWESADDMIAAKTPAIMMPTINGWNRTFETSKSADSGFANPGVSIRASIPMMIAPYRATTAQMVDVSCAILTSFADLIAMYRTAWWGCPNVPKNWNM